MCFWLGKISWQAGFAPTPTYIPEVMVGVYVTILPVGPLTTAKFT
jgi:hypothetical protein